MSAIRILSSRSAHRSFWLQRSCWDLAGQASRKAMQTGSSGFGAFCWSGEQRHNAFSERSYPRWQECYALGPIKRIGQRRRHRAHISRPNCHRCRRQSADDCGGWVRSMPGPIDAHWHAIMAATPQTILITADPNYLRLLAARQAQATLMKGLTTVRDLGGPAFGLKRAIDEGAMVGPRIYPSGAFISQTSGHGDFRLPSSFRGRPEVR